MTRLRVAIVLFMLTLVPLSDAGAVPLIYEFTSGALTGKFTADFNDIDPFQSWKIAAPTGFGTIVWDSTNPVQTLFAHDLFPPEAFIHFLSEPLFLDPDFGLFLSVREVFTDRVNLAGTYDFHLGSSRLPLNVTGSGNWKSVPEPNTLWSLVLGLLAISVVQWLSHGVQELRQSRPLA
jgi:hypothetical protein